MPTLSEQFQAPVETLVERGTIDVYSTEIHDRSLSCQATYTSMTIGGVKQYV
jgi:hypothetical protein